MEELLEIWDWDRNIPTGQKVERNVSHEKGIPHEGVHLWIFRVKDNEIDLLFQRRSASKKLYPGYLDITVGGHVPFGLEKNKIQKESEEEIGINPPDDKLIDLGFFKYEESDKTYDLFHREFQHVYIMLNNDRLDKYSFNDGEVSQICAVSLEKFKILMNRNILLDVESFDGQNIENVKLSKGDFHPLFFTGPMREYIEILIKAIKDFAIDGIVKTKMPLQIG